MHNKFVSVYNAYKQRFEETSLENYTRFSTTKHGFVVNTYFDRQIKKWDTLKEGSYIKVGDIQENSAINKVGIPASTLYYDVSKIRESMSEHSDHLSYEIMKQIPNMLADPIVITQFDENTVSVFGELFVNNSPIMVGIVVSESRNGINTINKIRTVHARRDAASHISDENVLYLNENKKRTRQWFQALGISVPSGGTKFGFIKSIYNLDGNVNHKNLALPETDSEGNTLTAEQRDYFKDSKVVDKDGNLLVVYHGTDADFTVFDRRKARSTMDIQGNFFSPFELDAQGYGGTTKAYYLNITNPASESVGYNALKRFQGQNEAGIKAREYLESLGYDGVNNGNEEFLAFDSNQAKLTTNTNPTTDKDIRYSLKEIIDENNVSYGIGVKLDSTLLDNLSEKERIVMVKEYVKEIGGQVFTAIDKNGKSVDIAIAKPNKKIKNANGKAVSVDKDLVSKYINNKTKQEAIVLIDELIETSNFDNSKKPTHSHGWLDNAGQNVWEYWTTHIEDKAGTIWNAILNVANAKSGEKILYDIYPIKKVGQSVKSDTIPTNTIIRKFGEKSTPNDKNTSKSVRNAVPNIKVSDIVGSNLICLQTRLLLLNSTRTL